MNKFINKRKNCVKDVEGSSKGNKKGVRDLRSIEIKGKGGSLIEKNYK